MDIEIAHFFKKIGYTLQSILEDKNKKLRVLYRIDKAYRKNNENWIRVSIINSNQVFS